MIEWRPHWARSWKQRALTAERNNEMLRRDLERAMARYHVMLDERNKLLLERREPVKEKSKRA